MYSFPPHVKTPVVWSNYIGLVIVAGAAESYRLSIFSIDGENFEKSNKTALSLIIFNYFRILNLIPTSL